MELVHQFAHSNSSLSYLLTNYTSELTYGQVYHQIQQQVGVDSFISQLSYIEKLWASWYIYMNNDTLATGLLFFLTHELMYFGRCLPWFIIDHIPYFNKWKLQPTKIPTDEEQWECFKSVMKQHLFVEAIPIWLFHPLCQTLKISVEVPFPSWKIQLTQIAVFFFFEDLWHYTFHRLFHVGWFYKNIHKIHHRYSAPFGLAAEYAHPVEVAALGVGTVGFPILYAYIGTKNPQVPPIHLFTITLWIVLRLFQAVDSHSGYDFPWSLNKFFPLWAGAEHHDEHHHFFIGNYASSFRYWDFWLNTECGTLAKLRREKNIQQKSENRLKKDI